MKINKIKTERVATVSDVAATYVLVRLWSGGPSSLCLGTAWSRCESLRWRKRCRWALCQPCLRGRHSPPPPGGWRSSRVLAQGYCSERKFRLKFTEIPNKVPIWAYRQLFYCWNQQCQCTKLCEHVVWEDIALSWENPLLQSSNRKL